MSFEQWAHLMAWFLVVALLVVRREWVQRCRGYHRHYHRVCEQRDRLLGLIEDLVERGVIETVELQGQNDTDDNGLYFIHPTETEP